MNSIAQNAPVVQSAPEFDAEYTAWLDSLDRGFYSDECPEDETPDELDESPTDTIPAGFDSESDFLGQAYRYFFADFAPRPTDDECSVDFSAELAGARESRERQYEASYQMDRMERGLVHDGRYTDDDALNMGACG